jgi:hypothetical protein
LHFQKTTPGALWRKGWRTEYKLGAGGVPQGAGGRYRRRVVGREQWRAEGLKMCHLPSEEKVDAQPDRGSPKRQVTAG